LAATRSNLAASQTGQGLHVPIIGTHGVGKTSFIVSLGQLVSAREWGEVVEGFNYYTEMLTHAMDLQTRPLVPTPRTVRIRLRIDRIPYGGAMIPVNLSISTGDISGGQFEDAMTLITKQPLLDPTGEGGPLAPLFDVLKRANGLIVILDITRYMKGLTLEESMMKSFADQIRPLCNAIDTVASSGSQGDLRAVFFVFNKQDVHRRTAAELRPIAENAFAILLRRLRTKNVQVEWRACSSLGWMSKDMSPDRRLEGYGIDQILTDLVASLGIGQTVPTATPATVGPMGGGAVTTGRPALIQLVRPTFFKGEYYRTLADTIQSSWKSWSSEVGDTIPRSEIWIRLRKIYNCDIRPEDVSEALKVLSKERPEGTPDPVVIRGQKVQLLTAGGGTDELRITDEIKKAGGSLSIDSLASLGLAKEGWSRDRIMEALSGLERKGVLEFKDGRWCLLDSGPS
jgi:hypothetical protein